MNDESKPAQSLPLSSKAYAMLLGELSTHLSAISQQLAAPVPLDDEAMAQALITMHQLKGACGFFKLTELSALFQRLEKLLQTKGPLSRAAHAECHELVQQAQALSDKLPKPQA